MTSILSSLLDVNRLESGSPASIRERVSLSEVFESLAARLCRAGGRKKGLRLRLLSSELIVRSDKRMLEEMIRNCCRMRCDTLTGVKSCWVSTSRRQGSH